MTLYPNFLDAVELAARRLVASSPATTDPKEFFRMFAEELDRIAVTTSPNSAKIDLERLRKEQS